MRLKITNWKKYHPRSDYKTMPWFKIDNKIVAERKLYGCVPEQKWFWICLLSFAAQENSDEIEIDIPWASHMTGVPENSILQAIEHFEKKKMVVRDRTLDVRETYVDSSLDKRREDKRREERDTKVSPCASKPKKKAAIKYEPWDLGIATQLQAAIVNRNPDANIPESRIPKWANELRLLRNKYDPQKIEKVLDWTFKDDFWSGTIQSVSGLKKHWNKITGRMNSNGEMSLDDIATKAARMSEQPTDPNEIAF